MPISHLTDADRDELMKDWYEVAPDSDLRWNLRIAYEEI